MVYEQLKIIEHYGYKHQLNKLIEELRELEAVIINEPDNTDHIQEEIADVLNLIEQIIIYNGWYPQICEIENFKIGRQLSRIELENQQ